MFLPGFASDLGTDFHCLPIGFLPRWCPLPPSHNPQHTIGTATTYVLNFVFSSNSGSCYLNPQIHEAARVDQAAFGLRFPTQGQLSTFAIGSELSPELFIKTCKHLLFASLAEPTFHGCWALLNCFRRCERRSCEIVPQYHTKFDLTPSLLVSMRSTDGKVLFGRFRRHAIVACLVDVCCEHYNLVVLSRLFDLLACRFLVGLRMHACVCG